MIYLRRSEYDNRCFGYDEHSDGKRYHHGRHLLEQVSLNSTGRVAFTKSIDHLHPFPMTLSISPKPKPLKTGGGAVVLQALSPPCHCCGGGA